MTDKSKDIEMKDDAKKTEEVKVPEVADPFFGKLNILYNIK